MGNQSNCCSDLEIHTSNYNITQKSLDSQSTNDIDILRKMIIQPIKPLPLNRFERLKDMPDDDIQDILNQFIELEKD
ncbi:unnamed protein product [Paramecium sonneborni]|uniref:Uncharacterized protein n=1 Tax=Paramecium sonneborni TaxID=65129 RepID=A0A8S1K1F6_9CILI|nr:unnamed protein product [Paramecium sonneborni]